MIVRSIQGDDAINQHLNAAMYATLDRLQIDGLLTEEQANKFKDTHFCLLIDEESGFKSWFKRIFKKEDNTKTIINVVEIKFGQGAE